MINNGKGRIFWLFGRPSSGKTTIAQRTYNTLKNMNVQIVTLDGDELRYGINKDLGYSIEDREENLRRSAEIARLFASKGFLVLCSFITPTNSLRKLVLDVCNDLETQMVYVNAALDVCIARDVKGHYRKALNGEIKNFTGIDSPFDDPAVIIDYKIIETSDFVINDAVDQLVKLIFE